MEDKRGNEIERVWIKEEWEEREGEREREGVRGRERERERWGGGGGGGGSHTDQLNLAVGKGIDLQKSSLCF